MIEIEEIKELIKNAKERKCFLNCTYHGMFLIPQKSNRFESNYTDILVYGYNKNEKGISIEKITTVDVFQLDSFFKKIKGFCIRIDIPYLTNIIHISCSCGNHLISVNGNVFRIIKNKRK